MGRAKALGVFYIGGRGFVCQIIEPVTFARCAFIFALCNIALDGYLDTRRNINIYGTKYGLKHYNYIIQKISVLNRPERSLRSQLLLVNKTFQEIRKGI